MRRSPEKAEWGKAPKDCHVLKTACTSDFSCARNRSVDRCLIKLNSLQEINECVDKLRTTGEARVMRSTDFDGLNLPKPA